MEEDPQKAEEIDSKKLQEAIEALDPLKNVQDLAALAAEMLAQDGMSTKWDDILPMLDNEELSEQLRLAAHIIFRASLILEVLEKSNIEDHPNNATRFIVLSQTDHIPTKYDKTSIAFSFNEDSPGLLHLILLEFASRKINLSKIESRPSKQLLGQYVFLIDFEGHRKENHIKETLENILNQVSILKIFGSYPRYIEPNTPN